MNFKLIILYSILYFLVVPQSNDKPTVIWNNSGPSIFDYPVLIVQACYDSSAWHLGNI